MANREFFLTYQPQLDLLSGHVAGFEALVRWRRSDGSVVLPDHFIEMMERHGLIRTLGSWVLSEAVAQLAEWRRTRESLTIAVNVSPRQLRDPFFAERVRVALAQHDLPAAALCLEVTETSMMDLDEPPQATMRQLAELGCRIAIDDFGTGFASLQSLTRLPVSVVKIDRAFVAGMLHEPASAVIVRAVIEMAQALGVEAVAEGIETEEQVDRLRALGCPSGQGFLFSPALGVAEASALLRP